MFKVIKGNIVAYPARNRDTYVIYTCCPLFYFIVSIINQVPINNILFFLFLFSYVNAVNAAIMLRHLDLDDGILCLPEKTNTSKIVIV